MRRMKWQIQTNPALAEDTMKCECWPWVGTPALTHTCLGVTFVPGSLVLWRESTKLFSDSGIWKGEEHGGKHRMNV